MLQRVERALQGAPVSSLWPTARALTGLGAAATASLDVALAERAVEKLRAGREPHPAELEALEMGLRLARPALRLMGSRLPESPALQLTPPQRAVVEALLPGVALIGWIGGGGFATGFLVSPRVLVTNRHVAEYMARFEDALGSEHFLAWFADQEQPGRDAGVPIRRVIDGHPTEDVALVELAREAPDAVEVHIAREPALQVGDRVIVVGYPLFDARSPHCVDALFENVFSVKRASPGEITSVDGHRFAHDCSTLCGSSGSPIIDCRTGLVVGIHASGQFAFQNTAVSSSAIHADPELRPRVPGWS